MSLSSERALDPESAIWNQDLPELTRALDAGWRLPYLRVQGASVQDLSLAIRVVSLRWTDGWHALTERHPDLKTHPVLLQLAVRRGVAGVVRDMLAAGIDPQAPQESGFRPLDVLINALSGLPGEPVEDHDLVETAQALVDAGASPLEPYPGDALPGGLPPEGHTIWTRAVCCRRWEIAGAFLPSTWEEQAAVPHGAMAIAQLREAAASGDRGAVRVWGAWLQTFAEPWLQAHPEEPFSEAGDFEAALALPPAAERAVWERWGQADSTGWTALHDLGLMGKEPVAHRLLARLVAREAPCLARWDQPGEEGLRPCDFWELANGRTPNEEEPPVAFTRLPELLRSAQA